MFANTSWMTKIRNILFGVFLVFFAQLTLPSLFEWKINQQFWYIVGAVVVYFLLVDAKDTNKLARNAVLLIVSFGTVIALIRPVQYALDEESHLANAIGISDSLFFKYSKENLRDYDAVFLHDSIRNPENYQGDEYWFSVEHQESTVSGKPISFDNPSFIPGAIGWNIGRILSEKIYISYYLGRFFHVIAYAVLVFLAIKMSRVYQKMIYLMGTLPAAIYVVSAYHYDYLYYGASLMLLALLTNVLAEKEKITSKFVLLFQAIALLFTFSKFPFVLIGSVLVTLPKKYFASKYARAVAIGSFLAVMAVALVYSGIVDLFHVAGTVTGESPGLLYFLTHPLPIFRTMIDAPVAMLDNFVSQPLQYVSDISYVLKFGSLLVFTIFYLIFTAQLNIKLPKVFSYYTGLLLVGITFLVIYAITGDPRVYKVGDIAVRGVQGRYYFAAMCFLPLFISHWLQKTFTLTPLTELDEDKMTSMMQTTNAFLMILTVSIGFYTQI